MHDVVILSAARTPIGSFQGSLRDVPAPELGATALRGAFTRAGIEPAAVDQVYLGVVLTAGQGQAPARQATLAAGCPPATGAITIQKVCGSGMQAVMSAANDLRAGDHELVAAGGMESMSRAPYLVPGARDGLRLGHGKLLDSLIFDGLWDPYGDVHMGNCAELCAREYRFSREEQDAFARESYRRAREAQESGRTATEIVPVEVKGRKGTVSVDRDEEPFRSDLEKMGSLRPAFDKEGTVTAANASKLNDGAAALVLTTAEHAARLGKRPLARLVAQASAAQEPAWFTTAPVAAIRKALARARLAVDEIDLFEINEAFAVVALACQRDLAIPAEKLNVRGGAVALGHPIGASGARILVTLLAAMAEREARFGCAALCIGGGEATAMVLERLPEP
ncbi:MAG TPA: thiolase family protein [Thermoanaerobaculia bacterium]|nr:thiolase family protein [Thermoanaerobaculia bacterium]HRS37110.1 thiolase family protein [Thermoanaerobaculia bacterium]HRU09822.1 thiolase family protein [Thermoanaerobaculia bacterium]